jgi:hypothetical protein
VAGALSANPDVRSSMDGDFKRGRLAQTGVHHHQNNGNPNSDAAVPHHLDNYIQKHKKLLKNL